MARAARRAFTLVELLVAVGAVALIAVGLAAVFASVGDTVTGGRSVSGFTAYASLLERQLRDDISSMSRDGFLLIVNQEAEGGAEIELYPGQPRARPGQPPAGNQQRPRRIDELLFFRKGDFVSGREPLGPGYTARGSAAMVYYGHGTRQPVDERVNSVYAFPRATDRNDVTGRLGDPSPLGAGFPNPNRYASEWGLLRLPIVLAGDGGAQRDLTALPGVASQYLLDSESQIGGQPAAKSIFKTLEDMGPPAPRTIRTAALGGLERGNPLRTSGLVDIAIGDLDQVRRSIISSPAGLGSGPSFDFKTPSDIAAGDLPDPADTHPGVVAPFAVQQAWMLDALPAWSAGFIAAGGRSWSPGQAYLPDWNQAAQSDIRVRYEPAPPAYLEPMKLPASRPLERAVRLADQMALTGNLLVPRCTEFIVEWSFGRVTPQGRLIWHGIERWVDLDGDGVQDPNEIAARPYLNNDDVRFCLPYRLLEPAPAGVAAFASEDDLHGSYPVSPQLIHGFESAGDEWTFSSGGRDVLASFFGYIDPTFNPAEPGRPDGGLTTRLPSPFDQALPAAADHLPWAWPELIRITVSLADPSDPSIEQTFQFVFDAPGNPAP